MFRAKAILPLLALAMRVAAHGNVDTLNVGGQVYSGYLPYNDPYMNPVPKRIERAIPGNGPVEDLTLLDIQCNGQGGSGTSPAALVAPVDAGDQIAFHWTDWPTSHVGPVITYMAAVPSNTDITSYSPTGSDTIWFKIDEAGYENGKWAATDILISQNSTWTVTVPRSLAPGQYLVRHEIIALHEAESYPGAQFYPDCFQVEVTGSGTETPTSEALVSFPGGYTPDTPGIVFNVYSGDITSYPIPGPSVWTSNEAFSSGGSSSSAVATGTASAISISSSAAAPTTAASTSSFAASSVAAASSPVSSSAASVSITSSAATASATTITDANVCMNNYNDCINAGQPNPDWTGCSATKDACLATATYRRVARSGHVGRRSF